MWFECVSALIREHREKMKLTQGELAKKLGYSNSQFISNIERQESGIPLEKVKKLCRILQIEEHIMETALIADEVEKIQRVGFGKKTTGIWR